ncbi:hypothetical protein N0V93_009196 [Gnomoniopsis smithogilvyi]|uniref:RNA 3'-terminal phosphate cyclase domain-containing protein n=1 Tax=Gnomoniopsis smithogilvyi TaxID=1191159 RepID=A0A9W8YKE6_9PEZI|nr:hypothetical protein N0V93_009196 [Gnomoniopsis smithogilvyi]
MGSVGQDDDLVVLDGTADSKSGQSFRMAITLSSITLKPVRIKNIWGAREPANKRGMTASLVEMVKWFVEKTDAKVEGNEVGSLTLEFRPKHRGHAKLINKAIKVSSGSMTASAILTFQAIFPLLVMIGGNRKGDKLFDLHIDGATNCPEAPSFEYLDQVFLPAIKSHFGIEVICKLVRRGWGQMTPGTVRKGSIRIKFRPLEAGSSIKHQDDAKLCEPDGETLDTYVNKVVVNIVAPAPMHELLKDSLTDDIESRFHGADIVFKTMEDSGHCDRVYVLLVAHSEYCRWARDMINSESLKDKDLDSFTKDLSSKLCKDLEDEVNGEVGGECPVDQFLQDQLVIFQTIAEGSSCFPRQPKDQTPEASLRNLRDRLSPVLDGPMEGRESSTNDSQHTLLARSVAQMMVPAAKFYNDGKICIGAGLKVGQGVVHEEANKQALEPRSF